MAYSKPWEKSDVEAAKLELGSGKFASVEAACPAIAAAVGKPSLTPSAVLRGFKRVGERAAPSSFLRWVPTPTDPARAVPRPFVAGKSQQDFPQPGDFDRPMRVFIIPDVHVPNHHELAWNTCLAALTAWKPDRVVILGDFADDACVSSHAKKPDRTRLLRDEIDANNVELDRVQAAGCEYVDFLSGNHCDRLARFIAEKAPELYGLISMAELLRINERGWRWHDYKRTIKIGKLWLTHDLGFAGKNAAWQNIAAAGHSIVTGHTHWATTVYQGHDDGTRHVSVTSGWLGDPEKAADYRPLDRARREWQHGFTTAEIDRDGVAWVNFRPIIDGRVVIDGRVIRAAPQKAAA
jgi:predicted phosphodiesterase